MEISELLKIAEQTALKAGHRLSQIRNRRINSDAGNDVKLQEDVESELFIRDILSSTNIPVIGEEKGGDASLMSRNELYWVVDPIDGTYNFLRGIPGVCVSIGLMQGMKPVCGAIYDFTRDELFSGAKGLGLFINSSPATPNWSKTVAQGVIMTGFPSNTDYSDENMKLFIKRMQKFKKVRMCGSAALAIAWVASGRADCYDERRINLWDVAAGLAIIEGAGGVWKYESAGLEGKPMSLNIQAAANEDFYV